MRVKALKGSRQFTRTSSDYLTINISSNLGQLGFRLIQALLLEVTPQVTSLMPMNPITWRRYGSW